MLRLGSTAVPSLGSGMCFACETRGPRWLATQRRGCVGVDQM